MTNREREQATNFANAMTRRVRTHAEGSRDTVRFDPIPVTIHGAEHVNFLLPGRSSEVLCNLYISLPLVSAANRTVASPPADTLLDKAVRHALMQPAPEVGEYAELTEAGEAEAFRAADYLLRRLLPLPASLVTSSVFSSGKFGGPS